ncbi:hypothetical protein [Streptomyces thermolilacinus]|uniref:hypothetical protein n=1 Tax=Streptomyces thermolilacinus TaxID=285540 RepID=UPI0033E9FA8F
MTPADELRTAAEKIRAAAAAAAETSGSTTWRAERHFTHQTAADYTHLSTTEGLPLMRGGGGRGRPPAYVHGPVGDYIAIMGPGVGIALADWMAATAETLATSTHPDWQDTVAALPLAVARAINGTTS